MLFFTSSQQSFRRFLFYFFLYIIIYLFIFIIFTKPQKNIMSELINYSMGLRSNRVDPLLTEGQSKKAFPEARARRNSFSSKENAAVATSDNGAASINKNCGRKSLAVEFEKSKKKQATAADGTDLSFKNNTTRKTNPDALKQTTQERTVLGKKITTNSTDLAGRGLSKGAPFFRQGDSATPVEVASSNNVEQQQRFSNTASMNTDHFSKDNSALPCRGASSPKKQGLKYMQGPPEFVAEKPEPKIRHTHAVRDARGATCSIAGVVQCSANTSTNTTPAVSHSRRGLSSASYNIITGQ